MKKITDEQYKDFQQFNLDKIHGRILTPDGLRFICVANEYDPERIGTAMLYALAKVERRYIMIANDRSYMAIKNGRNELYVTADDRVIDFVDHFQLNTDRLYHGSGRISKNVFKALLKAGKVVKLPERFKSEYGDEYDVYKFVFPL